MTHNRTMSTIFRLTVFMLLVTGMGQMPLYKRYYISDIPGLGWLADFYATHAVHYIFALIFTLWVFYTGTLYLSKRKEAIRHKVAGGIRTVFFAGILISGFLMVVNNFPGYRFSKGFIIFIDLAHLAFTMGFLVFAGIFYVVKRKEP